MRFSLALSLVLAFALVAALDGAVVSARAGAKVAALPALTASVRDYRQLTWTYERIAHVPRTAMRSAPESARSPQVILGSWKRRADAARRNALAAFRRRLGVELPAGPGPGAPLRRQLAYSKRLTRLLERIVPAPVTPARSLASARLPAPSLSAWQLRAAAAALSVDRFAPHPLFVRDQLTEEFMCIHRHEGKWTANTGNGYYGGLQMDLRFQHTYAQRFVDRWGTADNWPVWAQVSVARQAYRAGRGFTPWPNTRRSCGV